MRAHRSIRTFTPEPVPDAVVREVLEEAIAGGSSSGNLNSYSVILTRDAARKEALYRLHSEQEMVREAPVVLTFCADWFRTREWLRLRGARDNFNNLLGYHVAAFDAMIVAQNVALAFEARGYGLCYLGTTLNSMRGIAELLELPETCVPVTTLVVGVPAEDPTKRDRLPLAAFLHEETYRRPDTTELEALYREREEKGWARYMAHPDLRARIEEGGITSLAEFYTSRFKYDPDVHVPQSAELQAFLAEKGFLPRG